VLNLSIVENPMMFAKRMITIDEEMNIKSQSTYDNIKIAPLPENTNRLQDSSLIICPSHQPCPQSHSASYQCSHTEFALGNVSNKK
jgi:hypothetical protein